MYADAITGKGLHSPKGVAKLKPAIEELIQRCIHILLPQLRLVVTHTGLGRQGLVAELDPDNSGVLIVNLDGQPTGAGPVLGVDEITRRLEDSDKGCVIM